MKKVLVRSPRKKPQPADEIYTCQVILLSGPIAPAFARRNPVVMRVIDIAGRQTLQDLHRTIFTAFDRIEDHSYEFQLGKGPNDPEGPRYVLPGAYEISVADGRPAAGRVNETTIDSLALEPGRSFGYWFDFGDEWLHQVTIVGVRRRTLRGRYPKITQRVGQSPPQYIESDDSVLASALNGDNPAADTACLVGEVHLKSGRFQKAIQAFSRALDRSPTVDAYEGRARAYRALAEADERAARSLR